MKNILTFLTAILLFNNIVGAQKTQPVKTVERYGIVDTADLKLTTCDFEKDANAMVLFDKATISYRFASVVMERHKRIKIFNNEGKDAANIRIEYYGVHNDEDISNIQAETINLNNKTIELTSVDKQLIYTEKEDKNTQALIFTFPNVKAGSIIEFKYKWSTPYAYNYPDWFFQSSIPTRYSELNATFDHDYVLQFARQTYQPMFEDSVIKSGNSGNVRHIWALANVEAYKSEPLMDYPTDYLQCVVFRTYHAGRTWKSIGDIMLADEDFGQQLGKTLASQEGIITRANSFKTNDEKIAYVFDTIKKAMKWNHADYWFTVDGVKKAWNKKTGNATEINLILFNLLKSCSVSPSLMALLTRESGRLHSDYPSLSAINRTVVYIPIDSTKYYVLDASNPYNIYNQIPFDLIGLDAISIDPEKKSFRMFPLKNGAVRETILVNGSISTDGKLAGTTQIMGSSYSREKYLRKYNELGEKKYIEQIESKNRGLKIGSLKLENMDTDSLPLVQNINLQYEMTEPDGDYLYFNPNVLTGLETNPFLSETRISNIDFGCLYNYSINGRYKIPAGYKADVLPKSVSMFTNDKSIWFKRAIGEDQGVIVVHYSIDFKRSLFDKDEYKGLRNFYGKMYEMLNDQIVLKKQ